MTKNTTQTRTHRACLRRVLKPTLTLMADSTSHIELRPKPTEPKRRRCREATIASVLSNGHVAVEPVPSSSSRIQNSWQSRNLDTPVVVSPGASWCCSASKPLPPPPPQTSLVEASATESALLSSPFPPSSPTDLYPRFSSSAMDSNVPTVNGRSYPAADNFPSSLCKFNSVLTAGLLNTMSPPPFVDKTRSSPTLFEMMSTEPDCHLRATKIVQNGALPTETPQSSKLSANQPPPPDKETPIHQRLMDLLASRSPGNLFNDVGTGDVKLTLSSKDGISISMSVHRQILVAHSKFFAQNLNEKLVKHQRNSGPYIVEIADCDDIEVYIETLRMMYCKNLRKKLMKEQVPRVLGILKVSSAIGFDAGVLSCLEYLEAAPWAEDEEEKVSSLLSELHLEGAGAVEVLKRVSTDVTGRPEDGNENGKVLLELLQVVLEGKDEKARREMKILVTKMLRENSSQADPSKESLYAACNTCLNSLRLHFLAAVAADKQNGCQILRQADNLHWLLDILIDRQVAEDFLTTWASLSELSEAHSRVPVVHRYEVSRVTARLFVGIGKGQMLASKEARCMLLKTWLVPFYDDFGWMRRASKAFDRHLIEDGLSNTVLTLPMTWQQDVFLSWFNRFLEAGDDCPNIQRGFEVWWRRAFWRRKNEHEKPREMRVSTSSAAKS